MKNERWVCSACEAVNELQFNFCESCGCPKFTSGDEVAKFKNPEKFEHDKSKKRLQHKSRFLLFPMIVWALLARGELLIAALVLIVLLIVLFSNKSLVRAISESKWAKATIAKIVGVQIALLPPAYMYKHNLISIEWFTGMMIGLFVAFIYWYVHLFYSKSGDQFIRDFMSKSRDGESRDT